MTKMAGHNPYSDMKDFRIEQEKHMEEFVKDKIIEMELFCEKKMKEFCEEIKIK